MSSEQASLSSSPQKLGRRAQKIQDRKDHILVTAARLFRERGYHAVSMDEIGAASGMSGPAMYKYFKDKAAILIAIVEHGTRIAKEAIALIDTAGLSDLEILGEHVRCYIDFTGEARDAMVVTVREVSNIPEWYRPGFLDDQRRFREGEVNLLMRIRPELSRSDARYICTNVFQGLISSSAYLYPADSESRRKRLSAMAMASLLA
jgi:AcrR family transcriptional regulator